ncbi:MAG: carboxypeptidase regulatory-like domain-containing protein [Thermoanaerobaculaceae bacterium]
MVGSGSCGCGAKRFSVFGAWLLALAVAGSAAAGNITGTVKDAVTGSVLQGVTVKVTQNTSKKATTNTSGVYTISSVTAGTYTLTATKTGYIDFVTGNVTVPASGTVTAPLILIQPKGIITGTVVSSVGGAAVSGATVKITGTSTSATTATNGTFTLYAATGSYTLTITKTGWVSLTTSSFSVTNGQTTALGSIPFVQNGTLTGTVVNSLTGAVVSSARVTVTGTSTYNNTTTSGVFTLTTGAGPVTLTVTRSGWLTSVTGTITVVGGSTTTVPAIQLTQLATVTGTVKEEGTNANLQGVTVTLQSDPTKTATTASNGTFSLASVPMGSQTLGLAKTGYLTRTSGPYTVNTTSFAVGTILLSKAAGTITGTVRDAGAGNDPLPDVTVSVNGVTPAITGTSGGDGTFALAGVPAGSQTVHAARDGWVAADSAAVAVVAGQTSSIGDLVLVRAGVTITGIVRSNLDTSPIEGVTVAVDEQPARTTTTSADGTYTLSNVTWGLIHLTVSHPAYAGQTREIDLGTGGANEEFGLEIGRGTVAGEVRDAVTGLGLAGVWVRPEDQPDFNTGTDWQGHFELHDLPVGTYRMLFSRDGYTDSDAADVVVQTGQTTNLSAVFLQPRPGTVFGTAHNPDLGQPLEGVTVVLARSGRTATTDAEGHYSFDNVTPGWEMVAFIKDGYISFATDPVTVANNETREVWGDLRPVWGSPIMLRLHGVVRDGTGAALEGAEVTMAGGPAATTAADGSYSLTLPRGLVVLRASKAGFQGALSQRLGTGCFYFDSDCRGIADLTLAMEGETGAVAATTTDPVTRLPRQGGLGLWAPTAFVPADTAPDGTRLLTGIPPGRLYGWVVPRTLAPGQTLPLDFHGPATIPEDEPRWAAAGIVTRATTGEPVTGAGVTLSNPGASFVEDTYTDEAGRWSLGSGPEGHYLVEAWTGDGLHTETTWEFDASNDEGLRLGDLSLMTETDEGSLTILSPTSGQVLGSNIVTVQCEATLPVADVYVSAVAVELTDGSAVNLQVTFDPDGRHFQITFETSVANGPHTLRVWALPVRGPILDASVQVSLQIGPQLAGVSLEPTAVLGGAPVQGTVTLTYAAAAGGTDVQLASTNQAASVPASVTVPEGQASATFQVATSRVASPVSVEIQATSGSVTRTAALQLDAYRPTGLGLSPASVLGSLSSSGTVVLNAPAPDGGVEVALTSANPGVASVPASITVPTGATQATFTVTTTVVPSSTLVEISATAGGSTASATLTVGPLAVSALTLSPASLIGGTPSTGTVTLNGPAPAGGFDVTLSSANPSAATVPATIAVTTGATEATFTVTTALVSSSTPVEITAIAGGASVGATLTVSPVAVAALALDPPSVIGGVSNTGTVTLDAPAPPAGLEVTLASSDPSVAAVPATVNVAAGATAAAFTVTTVPLAVSTPVEITATAGGSTVSSTLTVGPLAVESLALAPAAVIGGGSSTGTVTLNSPAPAGGTAVTLASSVPSAATVPASVEVPAGQVSATFTAATTPVAASTPVDVTATLNGTTQTAVLTVSPLAVSGVAAQPAILLNGGATTLTVTLNGAAPAGGVAVTLSSSVPATVPVPSTVTIPEGQTSVTVPVQTATVEAVTPAVITAQVGTSSTTTTITAHPVGIAGITFSPDPAHAEERLYYGFDLTGPAPVGSLPVAFSSSRPDVWRPQASSWMPDGTTHWGWSSSYANVVRVVDPVTVELTVAMGGVSIARSVVVEPRGVEALTLASSTVYGGTSTQATIQLFFPAGQSGVVVDLASSDPAAQLYPSQATVSQGSTTCTVGVHTSAVAQGRQVQLSATAAGRTASATLTLQGPGTLGGTVVEQGGGTPVEGATVQVLSTATSITTDASGAFSIALAPGTHSLVVTKPGLGATSAGPFTIAADQPTGAGTIAMVAGGTISGRVYYHHYSETRYAYGATVAVDGTPFDLATTSGGNYSHSLAPGTYTLTVSKSEHVTTHVGPITVVAGQTASRDIHLPEYGWLVGSVKDSVTNAALEGTLVTGTAADGTVVTKTTTTGGSFAIHLPPGSVTLVLSKAGYQSRAVPESVIEGTGDDIGTLTLVQLGSVAGTVVGLPGGNPIEGAAITLVGGTATTTSGATGTFTLSDLLPSTTSVRIAAAGWAPRSIGGVTVTGGQTTNLGTIQLDAGGTVTGTVVSALDASPVAGVTVTAAESGDTVLTDATGTFALAHQPEGPATLTFAKPGWDTRTIAPLAVTVGGTVDAGQVQLVPKGTVAGTVVDVTTSTPLDGVTVTLTGTAASATTDAQGHFEIVHTGGHYTLSLAKTGWAPQTTAPFTIDASGTANLGTLPLAQMGTIHGRVVGNTFNLRVEAVGSGASVITTSELTLTVLPGSYTLAVRGNGHDRVLPLEIAGVTVTPGQTTELGDLSMPPSGEVKAGLFAAYLIQVPGTVTSLETGRSVQGEGDTYLTLPPGSHTLEVRAPGFLTATVGPVNVVAGQTTTAPVPYLVAAGILLGSVADAATGRPIAGAVAALDGTGVASTTDADGIFKVSQVTGSATLVVSADGYAPSAGEPVSMTTRANAHAGVIALTRLTGTVTGTVQDGAGTPLAGAVVVCNATGASATTDASGAFTLAMPVGTHTLTVSKGGFASQAVGPLEVTSGATTAAGAVALGAAHGTLTVHVTDAASSGPVAGAVVTVPERGLVARTDATGTAVLALAPGYLTATAQLGARQTGPTSILRVQPGSTQTVELTLPATGWIEGSITLQEDGSPLVGDTVTLQELRNTFWVDVMTTRTDGAGHYRLETAPGQLRVSTRAAQDPVVDVTAGQTTQVDPITAPGFGRIAGSIGGAWVDRAGHVVTVTWGLGGTATATDLSSHTFVLGISPSWVGSGTSTLTFTDPDAYALTIPDVTLHDGHMLVVPPVTLTMYGRREGFIHATSGEAVDLADVTLDPTGRTTTSGVLAGTPPEHGFYRIAAPAGTYTLTVNGGEGYAPTTVPGVTFTDGTTQPLDLTVGIQPGWDIASITLDPTTVDPGGTVTGTITLTGPAPSRLTFDLAGNPVYLHNFVALSTSSAAVTVPANVEFAGGEQTKTFTVTVGANPPASATVTGVYWKKGYLMGGWQEYPGRSKTATLTILAPRVTALTLDPTTVEPGGTSTATVTLGLPARPGGTTVTLSTSNAAVATVPASVVVPEGATTATVTVTTLASAPASTVTVTAAAGGASQTATLALALPRLHGVAPGWTLAGTADVIAYGAGFDQGSVVTLEGPVYALGQYTVPLCDVVTFGCPTQTLPAAVDAAGATATFTAPASLGTGLYRVTVRRSGGLATPTSAWLAIDEAAKTVPAQTPEEHRYAQAIHSGQTVTGTFVAGGDPDGTYEDLNSYYFLAGAGARVSATLERVDTSKTWEHPDSLDPELLIATPAGYVPQNLAAYDIQPGVDLNARLVDAVLPVSGLYVITAATTKGAGAYRLHFEMTQPGTVAGGARVVPYAQRAVTMRQGSTVTPTAMVLDGRGLRLSGARVGLGVVSNPGDTGAVTFTATTVASNPDGTAQTTLTATAQGRVEIAATALDTLADPPLPQAQQLAAGEQGTASSASQLARIPRYQPVAYRPFVVTAAFGDLSIGLAAGKLEKVPAQRLHAARPAEQGRGQRGELRAHLPAGGTKAGAQASDPSTTLASAHQPTTGRGVGGGSDPGPRTPDPGLSDLPMDASTAVPLPEPEAEALALSTAGILACDQPTFALGIVPAETELHPPYTFTLTDLTPPTGGTTPQGEVGADGITGHRIEKTIRLKLEVKDATGQTPTHPVLVQMAVDGARHGHLVFDPDGTRRTCSSGAFLWHEPDGQGGTIPNDEVELTLGTLALWAGERPNPQDPSHVLPVWGTAEVLDVAVQPIVDGAPQAPSVRGVRVHPEPGRPDHLSCAPDREDDCATPWRLWADFLWNTDPVTGRRTVGPYTVHNMLFLHDPYNNVTFGQTATQATSADARVTPTFTDQTAGGSSFNACGYTVALRWEANPTMPVGQVPVTLQVERAADPDWGAGTIETTLTLDFEQGSSHCLVNAQHYDSRNGQAQGMEEGTFPLTVAPGAGEGGLPTTTLGDTPRLVLLALAGSDVEGALLTAGTEPSPDPSARWQWHASSSQWTLDPWSEPHAALELVDQPSFRFAIVDARNEVVPGTRFRVHRCPRYEHLTDPLVSPGDCTLAPVNSDGETGILPSLTLNEGGGANGRGYLGIELTRAPVAPGTYYVRVESLNGAAYRIRMGSDLSNAELDAQEEYAGAYMLCSVAVAEFLDQNFARVEQLVVEGPTNGYIRYLNPSDTTGSVTLNVSTYNESGGLTSSEVPVPVSRIGHSGTFLGPVTFTPQGWSAEGGQGASVTLADMDLRLEYLFGMAEIKREAARLAATRAVVPAYLDVQWLNADGTDAPEQVTSIVEVPDPTEPGRTYFVEETLLRIVAKDQQRMHMVNIAGRVRLDEKRDLVFPSPSRRDEPRQSFLTTTRDWAITYQGDQGGVATDLRPDRPAGSSLTDVLLNQGKSITISLRSLAGPRMRADTLLGLMQTHSSEIGYTLRGWFAEMLVCQFRPGAPCEPGAPRADEALRHRAFAVEQWVDQQSYTRVWPSGPVSHAAGGNEVRDWLEALAWSAVDRAVAQPGIAGVVGLNVREISEGIVPKPVTGQDGAYAVASSNTPGRITFFPENFNYDAFRWDTEFPLIYRGFGWDGKAGMTAVVLHEARHTWQYGLCAGDDADHDWLPGSPEAIDPNARRLKDSAHLWVGGENAEGHFGGDNDVEPGFVAALASAERDRDAQTFVERASFLVGPPVLARPQLTTAEIMLPVGPAPRALPTLRVGERRSDVLHVLVSGRLGFLTPGINDYEFGGGGLWDGPGSDVVVEYEVIPHNLAVLLPTNTREPRGVEGRSVGVTTLSGSSAVDVEGTTPGVGVVRVVVRQLDRDARSASPTVLFQEDVEVEVLP